MSHNGYGPSLSDQGFDPDDALVGYCATCDYPLDRGDMDRGVGVYVPDGRLLCDRCAPPPRPSQDGAA